MKSGKAVFSQLMHILPQYKLSKCVQRYQGNGRVRDFPCWNPFLARDFAQLSHRESLRDIEASLNSQGEKLYHMGLRGRIAAQPWPMPTKCETSEFIVISPTA